MSDPTGPTGPAGPGVPPEAPTAPAAPGEAGELDEFAGDVAAHVRTFLVGVREVASGQTPDTAIPELVVQLAQISMAGALLGAVRDVVPGDRFEEDAGADPDGDPLRLSLAGLLEGVDDYVYVFDPILPEAPLRGRVSDDVSEIVIALVHGLRHYEAGRVDEALWWWQFSYLSSWGSAALAAQRALHSLIAHQRLDADEEDTVAAQADALLRPH